MVSFGGDRTRGSIYLWRSFGHGCEKLMALSFEFSALRLFLQHLSLFLWVEDMRLVSLKLKQTVFFPFINI